MAARGKKSTVLLIEGKEEDVFQFRCAVKSVTYSVDVRVAENAEQARKCLEGGGKSVQPTHSVSPDLIIANLPAPVCATDFLKWLRTHPDHKHTPVILWSDAIEDAPVDSLLQAGANGYLVKRLEFPKLCLDIHSMLQHLSSSMG